MNGCKTCAYRGTPSYKYPCDRCYGFDKYEAIKPRLTNADRIRAMTDEELAKEFNRHFHCPPMQPRRCPDMPCYGCWLDWLKQPAEEAE